MKKMIKVGTRPSRLALAQVEEVKKLFPGIEFELVKIKTKGDKDKSTPLYLKENSDFFTYEIEQALVKGDIDVAVHSAKDLEENMPLELTIAALTKSKSKYDCLVAFNYENLDTLSKRAKVATSSNARRQGILRYRKDLIVCDIRGDIQERLEQLDQGFFDAIVVAHIALIRLGLEKRVSQIIPYSILKPHPLQGKLAIQVRKDRKDLINIFARVDEKYRR